MIQHGYQNEVRAKKICSGEEKNENDERKRDGDIEDRGQIEIPGFTADVQDKNTGKQKKRQIPSGGLRRWSTYNFPQKIQ